MDEYSCTWPVRPAGGVKHVRSSPFILLIDSVVYLCVSLTVIRERADSVGKSPCPLASTVFATSYSRLHTYQEVESSPASFTPMVRIHGLKYMSKKSINWIELTHKRSN